MSEKTYAEILDKRLGALCKSWALAAKTHEEVTQDAHGEASKNYSAGAAHIYDRCMTDVMEAIADAVEGSHEPFSETSKEAQVG